MESIPKARIEELLKFLEGESRSFLAAADVKPGSTPQDVTPLQMGYINSASSYLVCAAKVRLILKGK